MLDITKMLHNVINLEYEIDDADELMIGPIARRQTIFVLIDVTLSEFAKSAGWYKKITQPAINHQQLLDNYVKCLALILLYTAKRQWTHLVVMDDQQWARVTNVEPATKLVDLNKEYLAIKHFLNGAYYSHRQEDLRHAWHLLLKMGMVDFQFQPKEIEQAYQQMIVTEKTRLVQK